MAPRHVRRDSDVRPALRLALLQTYDFQSSLIPTYTAVWTRGTDPEVQLYTSSSDAIKARNSDLGSQGYRLVGLTAAGLERDNMGVLGGRFARLLDENVLSIL